MAHGHERFPNQGRSADVRTFPIGIQVGVPNNNLVVFPTAKALFDYQVVGIHYFIASGSCDVTFFVDANAIVTNESDGNGLHNVTVTRDNAVPDDYTQVLNGQDLTILITNISAPVQLNVRFECRRLPVNLARGVEQFFLKLAPPIDTFMGDAQATTVKGLGLNLVIGDTLGAGLENMILIWDLSNYTTILSAVLHMFPKTVASAHVHDFEIRRLIDPGVIEAETSWSNVSLNPTVQWPGGAGGLGDTDDTVPTPITSPQIPANLTLEEDYTFADITSMAQDAIAERAGKCAIHIHIPGGTESSNITFHSRQGPSGVLFEPKLWIVHEH